MNFVQIFTEFEHTLSTRRHQLELKTNLNTLLFGDANANALVSKQALNFVVDGGGAMLHCASIAQTSPENRQPSET